MLDEVASRAPKLDVVDAALATARRRRRTRNVMTSAAIMLSFAAVTVPLALGQVDRDTRPPVAHGSAAGTYEPEIVLPSSEPDDLPRTLDEPVAMLLSGRGTDEAESEDVVVTASGRLFRLANSQGWTPTVSPDGRVIVFYDSREEQLVSWDLSDGSSQRYTPIIASDATEGTSVPVLRLDGAVASWSPDGSVLAVLTDFAEFGGQRSPVATLLFVATGDEQLIDLTGPDRRGVVAVTSVDWADADALVAVQILQGVDSAPVRVATIGVDGVHGEATSFDLGGPVMIGAGSISASPDGRAVAWYSTDARQLVVSRKGTTAGPSGFGTDGELSFNCSACDQSAPPTWLGSDEVIATPGSASGDTSVTVTVDTRTGETRGLVSVAGADPPRTVAFAREMLEAGPSREVSTTTWLSHWGWWLVVAAAAAGIVVLVARRRRDRRDTAGPSQVTDKAAAGLPPDR